MDPDTDIEYTCLGLGDGRGLVCFEGCRYALIKTLEIYLRVISYNRPVRLQ